ncbi:hypothetical protein CCYA_CCYA09G2605 [Cyanidiococcus yangmingshanensis]|nr:hypothetical protein CCYA_CCYA09G2605 [Cyanidiococcus yangmingshanensis]
MQASQAGQSVSVLDLVQKCSPLDWSCFRAQWSSLDSASKALIRGWLATLCAVVCTLGLLLRRLTPERSRLPRVVLVSSPSTSAVEVGAGKTTLFWQLIKGQGPRYPPVPSQEPNEGILTLEGNVRCLLVDLPSDARTRAVWERFVSLEKAPPRVLIYVVDANKGTLGRETEFLCRELHLEGLVRRGVECIILANKADLRTSMPPKVFQARFMKELERLGWPETRALPQIVAIDSTTKQAGHDDLAQRLLFVHGSAKTGEGIPALRTALREALRQRRR